MRKLINKIFTIIDKIPIEAYLAIYLWGFAILRPILNLVDKYSIVILMIYAVLLISCFLIKSHRDKLQLFYQPVVFIGIVCGVFIFDYLFRRNDYTFSYFYNFMIYGVIPVALLSYGLNCKVFLQYYAKIAVMVLAFSLIMPFINFSFVANYMDLGYTYFLPSFVGTLIYRLYNKKFIIIVDIMLVISFVETALYANRGAFLSAVVFILIYYFVITKQYKNIKKTAILTTFIIAAIFFGKQMFSEFYTFLEGKGMNSYSLRKLYDSVVNADYLSFLSGRDVLWKEQFGYFLRSPFIGTGTGYFQSQNSNHLFSHNVFLEVLCSYGLIGFSCLIMGIITSVIRYYQMDTNAKNVFWLFFILWCPTMLLSQYLYINQGFWLFMAFILVYKKKELKVSIEENELYN